MVEIGTILSFIQAAGIIVGVAYYILNIQNNQRNQELSLKAQQQAIETRNTQFFITLHNSMDYESILTSWKDMAGEREWSTFEEWWDKFGPENNIEYFTKWLRAQILYEIYGTMVKRGFIDISLVDDMLSGPVMMYWEASKPIIYGLREKKGYPQFQEHFEYLADRIRKMVSEQHPDFKGQ